MKKRVGIILDSLLVSKQVHDLIKLSHNSKYYEITTILLNDSHKNKNSFFHTILSYIKRRGVNKFFSTLFFKFICMIEEIYMRRNKKFFGFYDKYQLLKDNFEVIKLEPLVSKSGFIYRYKENDIDEIRNNNLDLLIHAGGGILKGDILTVCSNGIISFHHADNSINRGGPPGFWEVYQRNPRTGFIIQKLKEELDGGDVLFKGFIATSWFYSLNLARLYEISNPCFHDVIENITSNKSKFVSEQKVPYSFSLYTTPSIKQSIIYLMKINIRLFKKLYYKIRQKTYRWAIAYQFVDNWRDVTIWRSKKIPNPKNRFLADPFVIYKNGSHYCFVEDYDYKSNKGSISAYKITNNSYERLGIVLEEEFHLSYPFLFHYQDELYMCPETHEKEEIRIYKCIEFPRRWVFHKTLMKDVSAVDTNIFEYQGKWWLFTNFDKSSIQDHSCQLHIFHNKDPLTDNWTAHELNPVIFDSSVSRNGGMIIDGKDIYRVFQKQGFDMYGEGSGIAKINLLSKDGYDEEIVANIEAKFFNKILGTHTYNYSEGLLALDYVEKTKINTGDE